MGDGAHGGIKAGASVLRGERAIITASAQIALFIACDSVRVFPFGLGGKPFAAPPCIGVRFVKADMADRSVQIDRAHPRKRHGLPSAIQNLPIERRFPAFLADNGPPIREPKKWITIRAICNEFDPLPICYRSVGNAIGLQQYAVARTLIVESKVLAAMPYLNFATVHIDECKWLRAAYQRRKIWAISRMKRI